ncbi:type II toxin-antitoxin system RelE/ParE family toxin [Patescibacteria group bacterium]|nr:type II toxin-antitoxin system RelE/ParE family toxin [Patescibacteria group bacterium]
MKQYHIQVSSRAQKDLKKIDSKAQQRIIEAIFKLKTQRRSQQFRPLVGSKIAQFRLRVGDYRVLYDVYDQDQIVLLLRIGHRKNIYR